MLLLLDSNLLLEILQPGDTGDIYTALAGWAARILKDAEFKPRGKTITLLVSTGVFKDHRSALGRKQYRVRPDSWAAFKKSVYCRKGVGDDTYFSIHKIAAKGGAIPVWRGDKYDKAYFEALVYALNATRFDDRLVVFGSNDRPTCAGVDRDFSSMQHKRLHIVSGRGSLESLIMD